MADPTKDMYEEVETPDFADMYGNDVETYGTGSEEADNFIGSTLAFSQLRKNPPEVPVSTIIGSNVDQIKTMQQADVDAYIDSQVPGVLGEVLQTEIEELSDLYATTGDHTLVGDAEAAIAEAELVKQEPRANQLVTMALAELQAKGFTELDKDIIAREANLAQIAEYLENVNMGWKEFIGTWIPFRNTYQFVADSGVSSYGDYKEKIRQFRDMLPEERIQNFPQILEWVWELSGANPFYFQERALPFLDLTDISAVNAAFVFDAIDAASIIPFSRFARFVTAHRTPIKFAANAGETRIAAQLVDETLKDGSGQVSKRTKTAREDATWSALPFDAEGIIPEATNGLSADVQKIVTEEVLKTNRITYQLLYDGNLLIRRSPLTSQEIAVAQQKYLDQFAGRARIVESDETGFTVEITVQKPAMSPKNIDKARQELAFKYQDLTTLNARMEDFKATASPERNFDELIASTETEIVNTQSDILRLEQMLKAPTEPTTKLMTRHVKYTYKDTGELTTTDVSILPGFEKVQSPETIVDQMLPGLVHEATSIGFTQQKMRAVFEEAVSHFKNIPKKDRKAVSDILLQGDRDKIGVYSNWDLVQGIKTPDGIVRLETAEQLGMYHALRNLFDTIYALKNRQLRRELEFEGWRAVRMMVNDEKVISFVKPGNELKQLPAGVKRLYDFNSDQIIDVGSPAIINRRIQEEGWQLLRTKFDVESGDELIQYVLARPSDIKRLPDRVLGYRAGYVPRIYKDVFFVAEKVGPKLVNGVTVPYRAVARYFDNVKDANTWKALEASKGELVEVRPGREFLETNPGFKQEYEASIFGGMYSGRRSDKITPFGLEGTEAERIGAFEALEAGIGHISTRVPMNEFRMGAIRRFLNSAKDPVTKQAWLENPADWQSKITLPPSHPSYVGLEAMQNWMTDIFRIPTAQERAWDSFAVRVANAVGGTGLPGAKAVNRTILRMGQRDVYADMRSLAFHALLGWFNPSQLYVQALGASVAFSINPAKATYIVPRYMALRAAMWSKNPEVWRKYALAAAINPDDFVETVRAFRKTGIKESVRSTADYDAAIHGFGISANALSRAADMGLIFFREGETFMRGYGWLLAHDEARAASKWAKGHVLTDREIDAITSRSLTYTMNLNRANRAWWQKGVFSIPTQFLQITAKFIENLAFSIKSGRGKWTPWEKQKIMLGQAVLFGAAGVPFGEWATNNLLSYLKDEGDYSPAIKDPAVLAAINGGFAEFLLYDWTGESLAISRRAAIPEGITSFFEMLMRSDRNVAEIAAGAFGETGNRILQTYTELGRIMTRWDEPYEALDQEEMLKIASAVAEITSTWRNYHKAQIWEEQKKLLDSRGNPIQPLDPEEDHMLIIAQKWGLQPRAIEAFYDLKKYNQLQQADLEDVADAWVEITRRYLNSPEALTDKGRRRARNMLVAILDGKTQAQKEQIAEMVLNRLQKDDYQLVRELTQTLDNIYKSEGDTTGGLFQGHIELNPNMLPSEKQSSEEVQENAK